MGTPRFKFERRKVKKIIHLKSKNKCPNCFNNDTQDIIRLRDGLYCCRKCNTEWAN